MLPYDSISEAIHARHLMTPLGNAVVVQADATVAEAATVLRPFDFDQAPVVRDGTVIGLVFLADLARARVGAPLPLHPLASRFLVNGDAPVGVILSRLAGTPMLFVADTTGLTGFVTPSDLNKHPARTHFYLLLADLEMSMAEVARRRLPRGDVLAFLAPKRRAAVEERHVQNKSFRVDADELTAFEFADLVTVIKKARLTEEFGLRSGQWKSVAWPLAEFRNDVMHPTREFLGPRTVADLVRIEGQLRGMLSSGRELVADDADPG